MKKVASVLILLFLISCKPSEVNGIVIGETLKVNNTDYLNNNLAKLISNTLNKDEKSLVKIINFECGGASGCYDLGYVITQIIYKLGENEFISIIDNLDKKELIGIKELIEVGLEYGDNNYDGKIDNRKFENEFPTLKKALLNKNL